MAELVRTTGKQWAPEREVAEEMEERSVLQRWIELPDGSLDLLELPLTPELYLNPELDDKMVQGEWHDLTCDEVCGILRSNFRRHEPGVRVFHDLKHLLGPGLPAPAPDVSVVRGIRDPLPLDSLDLEKEGVRPMLVVEVVSPLSARVRETDLGKKVKLYQRVGIPEYLIVDTSTRKRARRLYTLLGYRLDAAGRYQSIEPDAEGRILSESTGVWFQIAPTGDRVLLFEATIGRRLLNLEEQEERANSAEAEVARLRAEIERLRGER
ncbi:MAG TPA: Uma2 family endonuclease [Thermoanaerobaculia bacterium]|nr:Uma2 family endonuclease [Thermoanaerobaculia bacterium]